MTLIDSAKLDKEIERKKRRDRLKKYMWNLETVQYPFRIPKDMYTKARKIALDQHTDLRTILLDMLSKYVEKNKKPETS